MEVTAKLWVAEKLDATPAYFPEVMQMATPHRKLEASTGPSQRLVDLTDASDIISIDEVARRLDIPKTTLYGWRYKGTGPRSHRIGKHLRYRWSDVLEWLDNHD